MNKFTYTTYKHMTIMCWIQPSLYISKY